MLIDLVLGGYSDASSIKWAVMTNVAENCNGNVAIGSESCWMEKVMEHNRTISTKYKWTMIVNLQLMAWTMQPKSLKLRDMTVTVSSNFHHLLPNKGPTKALCSSYE